MICRNVHGVTVTSEFIQYTQYHSKHIAHEAAFKYFFDIVNQISETTHAFFGMLHNFYLVKIYVHGVTISQKQ